MAKEFDGKDRCNDPIWPLCPKFEDSGRIAQDVGTLRRDLERVEERLATETVLPSGLTVREGFIQQAGKIDTLYSRGPLFLALAGVAFTVLNFVMRYMVNPAVAPGP